jgi:hypothetical protein
MFLAQSIVAERPAVRYYDRAPAPAPTACQQGQLGLKTQAYYYKRSAGGIYNMASHQILPTESVGTKPTPEFATEVACSGPHISKHDEQYFWGNVSPNGTGGQCFKVRTVKNILEEDDGRYLPEAQEFYSCSPDLYGTPGQAVPVWNNTPYYVMKAPAAFIRNHDDIFQKGLYNLLMLMINENNTVPISPTASSLSTNGTTSSIPIQ